MVSCFRSCRRSIQTFKNRKWLEFCVPDRDNRSQLLRYSSGSDKRNEACLDMFVNKIKINGKHRLFGVSGGGGGGGFFFFFKIKAKKKKNNKWRTPYLGQI